MEDSQKPWSELASSSLLLKAVASWRVDPGEWIESAFERLPETVRVNPLRHDSEWVEQWLKDVGAVRIGWFKGPEVHGRCHSPEVPLKERFGSSSSLYTRLEESHDRR